MSLSALPHGALDNFSHLPPLRGQGRLVCRAFLASLSSPSFGTPSVHRKGPRGSFSSHPAQSPCLAAVTDRQSLPALFSPTSHPRHCEVETSTA